MAAYSSPAKPSGEYCALTKDECRELTAAAVVRCGLAPAAAEVVVLDTARWLSTRALRAAGYGGAVTAVQHDPAEFRAMCETLPRDAGCGPVRAVLGDVYDHWLSLPAHRTPRRGSTSALVLDLCGELDHPALAACLDHRPPAALILTTPAGRGRQGTQAEREARLRRVLEPRGYFIEQIRGYRGGKKGGAFAGGEGQLMVLTIAYRLAGAPAEVLAAFRAHGHAATEYHLRRVRPAPGGAWVHWWGYGAPTWEPGWQ